MATSKDGTQVSGARFLLRHAFFFCSAEVDYCLDTILLKCPLILIGDFFARDVSLLFCFFIMHPSCISTELY